MVNSSPEYAITKAGVYNTHRKRDKALRTYGRRGTATPTPTSTPTPEQSPRKMKRVRFAAEVQEQEIDKNEPPSYCGKNAPTRTAEMKAGPGEKSPQSTLAAKHTILNYFKPVSPSPTLQKTTKRKLEEPESPVPKAAAKQGKRRRLLSVRPTSFATDPTSDADDESETPTLHSPLPLQDGGDALHNRGGSSGSPPKKDVQTTLNISSQAAFSECKVCDTVWNPLYPDDVKYHTKRHAAHLRAVKKKELDTL